MPAPATMDAGTASQLIPGVRQTWREWREKMKPEFLKAVQLRAARLAATASSTRRQGAKGVVESARGFLGGLSLRDFGIRDGRLFARRLDQATRELCECLPKPARSWGLSRKLLNIFLRDSLYTGYLASEYSLADAEYLFEVPLDSITAKGIREEAPGMPMWAGVKYLDPETSAAYQEAALQVAKGLGVARVHLDTYWWGARE